MKMIWLLSLFSLFFCLTGLESVEFLTLHDPSETLPVAVRVENELLKNVSSSVLMAEAWVRTHVLSHYPSSNISTILVGNSVFCEKDEETNLNLILPSLKNIHYSLTRWGLQKDIKVSVSFTSQCLDTKSEIYLSENFIKPLLYTLQEIDSPYVVSFHTFSEVSLKSHLESMKKIGFFHLEKIKILISPRREKPSSRKLSFLDYNDKMISPFPKKPTPVSPTNAPSGDSLPPLVGTISPEPVFSPSLSPVVNPPVEPHWAPVSSPPFGPHLPPCNPPSGGPVGSPAPGPHNGLWCVAKPSVPPETLQEALDYACGEGGADCEAIGPSGSCYFPDTVVAHASYAFNSYWQKTKKNGGTCEFGGTAMLINSDPSYRHCRFTLN